MCFLSSDHLNVYLTKVCMFDMGVINLIQTNQIFFTAKEEL